MSVSVCIAAHNEPYINLVVEALLLGADPSRLEIIIYDDASDEPIEPTMSQYPNVKVLRGQAQRGVGFAFDRCVEVALFDNIVLMGGDVFVSDPSWIDKVESYCFNYRAAIGCSVCLSGDPTHLDPLHPADEVKRYGAEMLPFATTEDLPSDSLLLERASYYIGAFDARWYKKPPKENISEIPSCYGAFYFSNKAWLTKIGGWNTVKEMKLSGLSIWGGVDVFISLKSYLFGGVCHVVSDLETLHCFHKYEHAPNGKVDHFWYSKLFIAYTLMEEADADRLAEKIYSLRAGYELHTRPFSQGKNLLKRNWDYVMQIRERNKKEFIHDMDWFLQRFNIEKKW